MSVRLVCPACGSANDRASEHCSSCGTPLPVEVSAAHLARKTVTILFSDIAESTRLAEELDPESLQSLMTRYFNLMRLVIERHGGTVEKFVGDAVMAVFGVPRLHEDDTLRALRAAMEMRQALQSLNEELGRRWGVRIVTRTGVNTGEVIAGDPSSEQSFVAGDAVNVAARLQQVAEPHEILIGQVTYSLVRDAVVAERVAPLALKGKTEPFAAWRLLELVPGAPGWTRRLDSVLVGRDDELTYLRRSFDLTARTGQGRLLTLMGPAGIGKSRLANELLLQVKPHATVLTGRCLPYGEGITFWPLLELLRHAGVSEQDSPDEARSKLVGLLSALDSAQIVERLLALLGLAEPTPAVQEIFWAAWKLLEGLARRQPVVVVFEDIHWGEPTFLDLVEYLADSLKGARILLICLARPELLDTRPEWVAGKENAGLITLQPLNESQSHGLVQNLLGGAKLLEEPRLRIWEVTEGNPLFVEETVRMLVDAGVLQQVEGGWRAAGEIRQLSIPPTINALLTARLDKLEPEERTVIERASVIGRVFSSAAVSDLLPEPLRTGLGSLLQSLSQKELILPDNADFGEGDNFRFAHILVRDAAYETIPKSVRAELHERVAESIERKIADGLGEFEEIRGYHLEQAYRLLTDLAALDERTQALGRRAAVPLASAGRRALSQGDMPAAANLLSRAVDILPQDDSARLELLTHLGFALMETGDFEKMQSVVTQANEAARALHDPRLEAHAVLIALWLRLFTDPIGWVEDARREVSRAISTFEHVGDEHGLAKGWNLLSVVHLLGAQFRAAEDALEKAISHAQHAGERRDELENLSWLPLTVWAGPTPAEYGIKRCEEIFKRAQGDRKAEASALFIRAGFEAMLRRFEVARELVARAKVLLEQVALTVWIAGPLAQVAGWIELTADSPRAAERELRTGYEVLREMGEISWLSTTVALLAEAVYEQGRHEEAHQLTEISEGAAGSDDVYSQVLWRSVRAKALAKKGQPDEAERLARDSVRLANSTDFLHLRAQALVNLAAVLRLAGRRSAAEPILAEAIQLYQQKGNVASLQKAESLLAEVDQAT